MKKNTLTGYFLIIGILTFVAIFVFVVQQSYSNLMKPVNEVQNNNLLKSIDPSLDISILEKIEKRHSYFSSIEGSGSATPTLVSTSAATH